MAICSFVQAGKYLLGSYCMPGAVLASGDTKVNKFTRQLPGHGAHGEVNIQ